MKVGIFFPNFARWFRSEGIWAACEKAKEIGLDAIYFGDHVIVTPTQYVGYGNGYMDIWTALAYVAAVTNIQGWKPILGQCVVVIPYRPPIQQAKVIATVDSLSGGRVMVCAGSGYNENEFSALGLNIRERGNITDEYLACMRELWTHPVASFHGKYVSFDNMTISVRPAQQHVPILYGARGPRPFRRIAERYDGWVPSAGRDRDAVRSAERDWAEINRLWKEYGREGKPYLSIAPKFCHLTTNASEAGVDVVKGLGSPNPGNPQTVTLPGGHSYERYEEGAERSYISHYTLIHVDELARQMRAYADMGADMFVVNLASYRYGGFDNQGLLLSQMELLAEHVLPKIPKS